MKSDKSQSLAMIGIVLLVLAGIMIYISLSAPRVYEDKASVSSSVSASQLTQTESAAIVIESTTITTSKSISYPLNINTASAEELMTIDGLGEKRAYAIIEYRNQIGKYTDVSEVMNIKGIGESLYAQIAPYLTV